MSALTEPLLPCRSKSLPCTQRLPFLSASFLCVLRLCFQSSAAGFSLAAVFSGHCLCLLLVWRLSAVQSRGKGNYGLSLELGLAALLPFLGFSLLKSELTGTDLVEAAALAVWCGPFTRLLEQWKLGLGQTYIQLTCTLLCVFGVSYLLRLHEIAGGLMLGLQLAGVFLLLRTQNLRSPLTTQRPEQASKPPAAPIVPTVAKDFKRVRAVMDYLGTLEGGKVDLKDFLPALYVQWPDLPQYMKAALDSLCGRLVTLEDMVTAGNAVFQQRRRS